MPVRRAEAIRDATGRIVQIERIGDTATVQVYADAFNELSPDEKRLIWHLSQAAIAGRDIYYDQRYARALTMRDVIEGVLRYPTGVSPATLERIDGYAHLFWINNGPHLNSTSHKFVLDCAPDEFARAVEVAATNGAPLPLGPGERLDDLLRSLGPAFFDPAFEAFVTRKNPAPGEDLLASSANNLYSGVRLDDLETFAERYPLNSRLVRREGTLVEEVCRIGGRYGLLLAEICRHLRAAVPLARQPMQQALRALIRFYETGEDADRLAYDIAWIHDTDSPVDTINGFIEVHLDPRGVKGSWEALVFYVNRQTSAQLARLARRAAAFEARMPYDPRYRRPTPTGISARAIDAVTATGEAGPLVPFGINLPNDVRIRAEHGSKSIWLTNVNHAFDSSLDPRLWTEFAWDAGEAERARRYATAARELATSLHEVIGHGSGRSAESLRVPPQEALREFYSTLEETRADLIALYLLPDSELVDLGLVAAADHEGIVRAAYEAFTRESLVQLRRIRTGQVIELDHFRSRQLIFRWMREDGRAVAERTRDGRTFHVMLGVEAFRDAAGRLLAEVQRIKSEGDYDAARTLVVRHGSYLDERVRDEVVARAAQLSLRSYSGCVMPRLEPVTNDRGDIVDVRVSYPLDFKTQMLEYSALSPRRRVRAS